MSGCPLVGVNAFRSSVQIAFQQLPKPSCGRLRVPPPSRCFSLRPLSVPHPTLQCQSASRPTADRRLVLGSLSPFPSQQGVRTHATKKSRYAVITHYVEIPRNYDDATGLPFRQNDLGPTEVVKIFGPSLSTVDANQLLRIIHGRRVAGTLDDPELRVNTVRFKEKHKKTALEWLRKTVPVDEITNAGLRAEDELAVLERGLEAEEGQEENAEQEPKPSGSWIQKKLFKEAPSTDVYGPSVFDAIRAKNIARNEELERQRKEAEEAKRLEELANHQSGELQTIGERKLGPVTLPPPSPKMQKWMDAATSDLEAPPEMSKTERILPSAVAALLLSGLVAAFAHFYTAPRRSERLFPDIPPAAATVGLLILANLAVYVAWKTPPLWGMLNRYFVLTPATPRPLQLVGAMFSHQTLQHAVVNLATLWFLGTRLHDDVGRGEFVATYASAGAVGFLGSLTSIVLRNRLELTTLGASGAVYGVGAAWFWLHRFEGFKMFGLIPEAYSGVPGMAFIGLAIGMNIAAAFSPTTRIDVASHLAGAAMGILAAHLIEVKRGWAKGKGPVEVAAVVPPVEAAAVVAAAVPEPAQKAK
ncbi:rhomboid protein 1, mitochondrial [Podospora conica]|nr:rhomboid protein 1, mitochondrial [Schizothecium conicum]